MMYAFTKEWISALAEALKRDEEYQHKAKGFDSSFQFVAEPVPEKGVPDQRACGLNLPQCDDNWEGIRSGTDYMMSGPYEIFHKIIKKKMSAVMAITTGKVKVKGNLGKLLKYIGATNRFVQVLGQIETEFEGDFGKSA
ncbi:MAG: SCP2 sterol-binding domain-containing protein [Desulfobacteraceae bacterium]|nr:MAG: SCP2 sterol-binding domain-containing protein [Desulfobacteraceae bacterium]